MYLFILWVPGTKWSEPIPCIYNVLSAYDEASYQVLSNVVAIFRHDSSYSHSDNLFCL